MLFSDKKCEWTFF